MSRTGMGRFVKSCSAMLLALSSLPVFAAAEEPVELTGEWRVSLDVEGNVQQVTARNRLKKPVNDRVEEAIRGWHFVPGTVNGTPAPTETTLYLSMVAVEDAGRIKIQFKGASTGPRYAQASAPKYPESAVAARRGGTVLLQVSFDDTGKVVDAVKAKGAPDAPKSLVKSALAAVRTWTFEPEIVGGRGVAAHVFVPFCFSVGPLGQPAPKCTWTVPQDGQQHSGNELAAINPVAQLLTNITDRTL